MQCKNSSGLRILLDLCKGVAYKRRSMDSKTGFCGDGCSFETVDIDCSMAFRMVELTIRRIMGGLRERKGDEIVFAGLITSTDAASVMANSQHRPSKLYSSIPPHSLSRNSSASSQSLLPYLSSAPLLIQLKSLRQGPEEFSSQGSPQAVSTPCIFPVRNRVDVSHPATQTGTNPKNQPPERASSSELRTNNSSAVLSHRDRVCRQLLVKGIGEV